MHKVTRRRTVVWGAIGLAVATLLALALWPRPVEVDAALVTRGLLRTTLDHEGKTRVRERYEVSAPVAGRVLRIELEPGDPVVADRTVLATLVPSPPVLLDVRSRSGAEANLAASRAALVQARAERDRAAARRDFTSAEWRRVQQLVAGDAASRERADAARSETRAAAEELAAAEAAVEASVHRVAEARAALLAPERDGHGGALAVRSPVSGVVLERLRQSAGVVLAGAPLVVVGDPADLEVVSDYLSTDAVKIAPGMRVEIGRWGGEGSLEGVVRRVEPHGFLKVSALGVEEQRVDVITDFTGPEARRALRDGYRVETRVVTWEGSAVLRVPTGALFRHGDRWAVFRVAGGRAHLTAVELGHRSDLAAEVVSGVAEGDRVAIHPPDTVGDGARVSVRDAGPVADGGSAR